MTLRRIRLELARTPEFPEGSLERGYEFHAPLTADGHLDADAFRAERAGCTVRRFWPGEEERHGTLHHTRNHAWVFSYAPGEDDDEAFHRLDRHLFRVGEYVTIREPGGQSHTFRVASVR